MEILTKLTEDLKKAMISGDNISRDTIRSIKGSVKNTEIEKGSALENGELLQVIQKAAKQRKESITQYKEAGREDLAGKEEKELAVIEKYLPEQLSSEEIDRIIRDAVTESGASDMSGMGKVMGIIMPLVKGKADGSIVNSKVKNILSEL